MKKIMMVLMLASVAFTSCKKDKDSVENVQPISKTDTVYIHDTLPGLHSIRIGGILNQYGPVISQTQPAAFYINGVLIAGKTWLKPYGSYGYLDTYKEVTDIQVAYTNDTIHLFISCPWGGGSPSCDVFIDSKLKYHFIDNGFQVVDETFIIK